MLLFRSVTTGMLGACLYFVVQLSRTDPAITAPVVHDPSHDSWAKGSGETPATVVDMAGIPAKDVPAYVRVYPGERIESVNDRPVSNDLVAGVVIADAARPGGYIDVSLVNAGRESTRRVLILVH